MNTSSDPYTPPASPAAVSRFRVVAGLPWGKEARLFLLPLVYLSAFSYSQINRLRHTGAPFHLDGPAWTAFGSLALLLAGHGLAQVYDASQIRRRSLTISGLRALAGSRATLGSGAQARAAYLFLTPEFLLMLSPRPSSLDQQPYRIALAEIARLESPGWPGFTGLLLLHLHSGEEIRLTVGRARLWRKLIEKESPHHRSVRFSPP